MCFVAPESTIHEGCESVNIKWLESIGKGCSVFGFNTRMSIVSFLLAVVANNFAQGLLYTLLGILCSIIFNLMKLILRIWLFILGAPSFKTSRTRSSSMRRFSHKTSSEDTAASKHSSSNSRRCETSSKVICFYCVSNSLSYAPMDGTMGKLLLRLVVC